MTTALLGRFAGLRARMVAAFCAVALLASVLASGLAYVVVRKELVKRTQNGTVTEVRSTLSRMIPPNLPAYSSLPEDIQTALSQGGTGRKVVVVEARHPDLSLAPSGLSGIQVPDEFIRRSMRETVVQRISWRGTPYLLVGASVRLQEGGVIAAYVAVSLEREEADLRAFASALLAADAAALAAALVLGLLATRGVLRPVRQLGRASHALGEGELDTRVEVRGRDELADLARTFNNTAEALERTVTELRAMEAASRRFVADVSHELRTPLTSLVALTDVLDERHGDGDAARLLAKEVRHLSALVENLIEISRFDSGAASLVLDDVPVGKAVAATLSARGWADQVAVRGPADLSVRIDARRFDVILANLVGNALRHGLPPVRIDFRAAVRDGRKGLGLTVTDHGPGIPEDLVGLVFARFVKADTARTRSEGSGLGLSIAQANAQLHDGVLEAANRTEGGAVFALWLPTGADEEADA